MPRILIDENVPKRVKEWLKKEGFNVTSISETGLKGAKDKIIAEYASKSNMTILTLDTDFAQLYYTILKGSLAVIVIKAKPATPSDIINILNAAQQKIDLKEIQNKLIIITKNRIRIIS